MTPEWKKNWLLTAVVLVVGLGFAYGLLIGKEGPQPSAVPEPTPPVVEVLQVKPNNQALTVTTQGTVRPLREINLVSRVAGRVESVTPGFAAGGFFAASEPLLKIEDYDYQFAIARAESQVAAARQRVAEEQGRALQAKREWRDLGSDQANALFLRQPQLAAAEAALKAAEADLGAARLDLERTAISVPFNGRISEKYVDIGQYVTPGTPIAKVYATDVATVRLPLTDRQVALLDLPLNYDNATPNAPTRVVLSAQFGKRTWEWQGEIVRTDASIDVDSRVVYAVAEIERPFAREAGSDRPPLAPGLFVNATISGRELAAVATLPRTALRSDGNVLIVDDDKRAQLKPVDLLHRSSEQVWVQGLAQGDQVIVGGPATTVAGMTVTVSDAASIAGGAY